MSNELFEIFLDMLEEARQGERNMRMAFGNQVSWAGVRKSRG